MSKMETLTNVYKSFYTTSFIFNYVNMCAYMWVYTCEMQMPTKAWKGHWVYWR